jgi:Protein of unknown function (DUF3606)
MADDKSKGGAADRARVSMQQKHEVAYWTQKWGISEEQLKAAHAAAGPMAEKIEAHLRKTGLLKR